MQKINHIMNTMLAIYAKKEFSTDDKYYEVKDHYHYNMKILSYCL